MADAKTDVKTVDTPPTAQQKIQKPDVVFIHYPCPDGLSARVLIEDYFEDTIEFRLWEHGEPQNLKDLKDKRVWFRDVAPPLAMLKSKDVLCARSIEIKDHHWNDVNRATLAAIKENKDGMFSHVTMELESGDVCGALMTFRELFPAQTIPYWLEQINKGDTNLIGKRTPDEKAYHAYITQPEFVPVDGNTAKFREACKQKEQSNVIAGYELLKKRQIMCTEELKNIEFQNYKWDAETNYVIAYVSAEGPHILSMMFDTVMAHRHEFKKFDVLALRWVKASNDKKQLSLRRPPESKVDLSILSGRHGGGGHVAASGVQGIHTLVSMIA